MLNAFVGFVCHRLAVMAVDFFNYGGVLSPIKLKISSIADFDNTEKLKAKLKRLLPVDAYAAYELHFDLLGKKNNLIYLMGCPYCLSIWVSWIVSIYCINDGLLGMESLLLVPIFAYFFTEKLYDSE